jgi:drug/metabolite transporter (DMT)-like permease
MTDFAAAYGRLSANARGALWMLASAFVFTIMVTLVKYLGDGYSPALQAFYRQAAGLAVLTPIILRDPGAAYKTTRPGLLLFRAACLTLGAIMAFYSYQKLPLADANALSFTRTLWMVPLAAFVLREAVGPWRLGATLVGFCGVLVMLRPSPESFMNLPALAALAAGLLFALGITGMKFMTRDHSLTALTVWGATLGLVLATPLALLEWRWPTPIDLALLAAMGAFGLFAQVCYIRGMTLGDAGAMAPIDYTRLVFAALVGFVLFQEVPDPMAMAGAAIVIAATLAITLREARLSRPPVVSPE